MGRAPSLSRGERPSSIGREADVAAPRTSLNPPDGRTGPVWAVRRAWVSRSGSPSGPGKVPADGWDCTTRRRQRGLSRDDPRGGHAGARTAEPGPGPPYEVARQAEGLGPLMTHIVDFEHVSIAGLESSPVAEALAGLRANEARYYKNKYDHVFTVEPAAEAADAVDRVSRILEQERDIVIASPPLEATSFEVDGLRMTYVFYESRPVDQRHVRDRRRRQAGRRLQALRRHGRPRRSWPSASSSRGRSPSSPAPSAAPTS